MLKKKEKVSQKLGIWKVKFGNKLTSLFKTVTQTTIEMHEAVIKGVKWEAWMRMGLSIAFMGDRLVSLLHGQATSI